MSEDVTLNDFTETVEETESEESAEKELFGLGKIPTDWSIESLSDIAEIIPGNSPPSSTYNDKGEGLPFFQGNSEFGHFHPIADTWCSEPRKEANKNDVLMSIRAPVGDLNIADRNCCIGRGLAALRPETANGLYLFYNLAERKPWLSRLATGSTFKSVTKGDLQLLDVPVPPVEEQQKIATVLYNVDQAIQKTEEIIEQTKRTKRGLMQELFVEGYYEHDGFDETKVGQIPEAWELGKINDYTELVSGAHVKSDLVSDDDTLTPYLTGPDDFDEFGFTVTKYTDEPTKFCEPNDTLVTVKGSGCGKATFAEERACISRQLKALRPSDQLEPLYLFYYIKTKQNFFETLSEGSAIPGLSNSHLTTLDIPVPSRDEQRKISGTLREFDHRIEHEQQYTKVLKRLKNALMNDLLSGTVRTTNTNIEVPDEIAQHG